MCFSIDQGRACFFIIAVEYIDDIVAVGRKERCDRFCEDLNHVVPIANLGHLPRNAGCHYSRGNMSRIY